MKPQRLNTLVRPNIRQLRPYASARSEFKGGEGNIFLDANENPYDTGFNRYPDPLQWTLKQKIGEIKKQPPENIFLGNGSDEAIDLLIRIFCNPSKDHIICLPPTYGMYQVCADISNVAVVHIPLLPSFDLDVDQILNKANIHSKLLFICSPNNPTGNSIRFEQIKAVAEKFSGIVVVDEAYIDFSNKPSSISLLDQCPNLVVLQTFSKAWGLAGIRLGMAFAAPSIIQYFNKVKPPYNVNILTQDIAFLALENPEEKENWIKQILTQRKQLTDQLRAFDFVQHIFPSDANFVLVKVTTPKKLYAFLLQEGIILRDRSNVLLCEGCLRITVGNETENQLLIKAFTVFPKN